MVEKAGAEEVAWLAGLAWGVFERCLSWVVCPQLLGLLFEAFGLLGAFFAVFLLEKSAT